LDALSAGEFDIAHQVTAASSFYTEHPAVTAMTEAEVAAYRTELNITVSGSHSAIRPIRTFAQSSLPAQLLKCTAAFDKPSAIQAQCWPPLLMGRDVIGIAKTGSGKTLGFMLPACVHILSEIKKTPVNRANPNPLVLVLAPTRELAMQTYKVCEDMEKDTSITSICIYGGVPKFEQIKVLKAGVHVVIATPGRLLGLLREGELSLGRVSYCVLDEADRMLVHTQYSNTILTLC
jgi:ATP-dependent RNA helicase DDX5/DBP2